MSGRRSLPHEPPRWVDPSREIWFVTLNTEPRGRAQLTLPDVSDFIRDAITFRYERGQWYPWLFVLMPDHAHALLSFPPDVPWAKTIRDFKHWIASQRGVRWQMDFFDHRLRDDESFSEKAQYLLANPVRAGLVSDWESWPHLWFPSDGTPFTGLHR